MQRTINPRILEILKEMRINEQDGLAYLLILHYDLTPNFIPTQLVSVVQSTGIVEKALDGTGLKWKISLFAGEETAFGWVKTEYVEIFKAKNSTKGGRIRECTKRLKKLFADDPAIRKDDVIGATKMYVNSTEAMYLMDPHYFIEKGVGANKTFTLSTWIEKYKEATGTVDEAQHSSNTMTS